MFWDYVRYVTGRCFVYLLKAVENIFEVENKKGCLHKVGNEELKNVKGVELKTGFVDFGMRENILLQFTNKTVLSMINEPFDICDFMTENETFENFLVGEEKLIMNVFRYIFAVVLKADYEDDNKCEDSLFTIYDFARLFENNLFNLSVVKIDDFVAFVEFIPIDQNYQNEEEKLQLIRDLIESSKTEKSVIESIMPYSDFTRKYAEIIKF